MPALYISETEAASLININSAIKAVEDAFSAYGKGKAFSMPRQRMRIRKGALHMLPGAIPYKGVIGFKAYTSFRAGLIFKTHLYSAETGEPLAIIDSNEIGRLRTGAASGVATKFLARKNSETVFIFGSGFQAQSQLEAVCATCDSVKKVYCVSKTHENAVAFAETMSNKLNIPVIVSGDIETDLCSADIIITVTTSNTPLFNGKLELKKGVHINAAGSNALIRAEIPEKTIEAAKYIVVDSKEVAAIECGDILPSLGKGRLHWNNIIELGDIVSGLHPGRTENEGISIFESQGMGLLDIACAEMIYRKALDKGMGVELPF